MDRLLTAMKVFVASAQAGNFSLAARRMELSTSTVSAMIRGLENHLGIRLINRTTRRMHLTDDGKAYFERCRHILAEIEDAENAITSNRVQPKGHLKVDLPTGFGRQYLVPALSVFTEKYPDVKLTLLMTDRQADLVDAGVDIALRAGRLEDSTFMARRVYTARFVACASPAFLARHGVPRSPQHLANYSCLGFIYPLTDKVIPWIFRKDGKTHRHLPDGHLNMNSADALMEAALCGEGIIYSYDISVARPIAAGGLVPILEQWSTLSTPLSLVYPQSRHLSAKVRAFSDFVAGLFPPSRGEVHPVEPKPIPRKQTVTKRKAVAA